MKEDNRNALLLSLDTGLRICDCLSARANQFCEGKYSGIARKTKKPFDVPVSTTLYRQLIDGKEKASDELIFPSPRDKSKSRTRQAVYNDLRNCALKCGLKAHISPHSARKIFAVEKFKAEGLDETQRLLQHDNISTTLLYCFADQIKSENLCEEAKPDISNIGSDKDIISRFTNAFVENLGGDYFIAKCLLDALSTTFDRVKETRRIGQIKKDR